MKKKWFALALAVALATSLPVGCGKQNSTVPELPKTDSGEVRYLIRTPSQKETWRALARRYTEETGVPITLEGAEDGEYAQALSSALEDGEAPVTLFELTGPGEREDRSAVCYDLASTDVYRQLISDSFALKDKDGAVQGVACGVATYGILCNKALLQKAGYTQSMITGFAALRTVADDLQARKDALGIRGAFASAVAADAPRLASPALFQEFRDGGVRFSRSVKGAYLDNDRQLLDLFAADATQTPPEPSGRTHNNAIAEFAGGEAVFCLGGSEDYPQLECLGDGNLGILPLYIGAGSESEQGLCTGAQSYWCVNKDASEEDIQATLDFLGWLVTSQEGTSRLANQMGLVCPYRTAQKPSNPLDSAARQELADGKTPVDWCFVDAPSDTWAENLSAAVRTYAANPDAWDNVADAFTDGWSRT